MDKNVDITFALVKEKWHLEIPLVISWQYQRVYKNLSNYLICDDFHFFAFFLFFFSLFFCIDKS